MLYLIRLFRINFMCARVMLICTVFSIFMTSPVFAEEIMCKIAVAPFDFSLTVENQEAPEIAEFTPKFSRYLEKALKKQPNIKLVQSPQMQSVPKNNNNSGYRKNMYNIIENTYSALDCDYVIFGELMLSEPIAACAPPNGLLCLKVTVCRKPPRYYPKRFKVMRRIPDKDEEKDVFMLRSKSSWKRIPVGKAYYDKALQEMAEAIAKEIQSHVDDDGSLIMNDEWRC